MRTLLRIHMDANTTNATIQDGTLPATIDELLDLVKPEASYFFADKGKRAAFIIFDMADPARIPVIAEPLFTKLGAEVEYTPVMDIDDLRRGLDEVARTAH